MSCLCFLAVTFYRILNLAAIAASPPRPATLGPRAQGCVSSRPTGSLQRTLCRRSRNQNRQHSHNHQKSRRYNFSARFKRIWTAIHIFPLIVLESEKACL